MWKENELYHYGVKGMKWGVRRYINKDGTLTDKGKRRSESEQGGKKHKKPNPNKWVKEDTENFRNLANEVGGLSNKLKQVTNSKPKIVKMDLSKMSDQEMRTKINRALLEKQYNDMFAPRNVNKGKEFANKLLDTAAVTMGVTSSALSIALLIKQLKG